MPGGKRDGRIETIGPGYFWLGKEHADVAGLVEAHAAAISEPGCRRGC